MINAGNAQLVDAICDNFMNAVGHGPWAPQLLQGEVRYDDPPVSPIWKTFCNYFVQAVADRLGYKKFYDPAKRSPIAANQIVDLMAEEADWMKEKDGAMAQYHANAGALVVAGQKDAPHGHVCVIRPGSMFPSGNWAKMAPRCANVGKDVFIDKGVNYAFKTEPDYFVLKSTIPV